MELHHDKHHRTYVNSYNAAMEKMGEIQSKGDIQAQIAQQPLINFHGGAYDQHHHISKNINWRRTEWR
jgi:Fe-Mn family superoxide dismutase